jgi:hypothetical protein
MAFLIVIYLLLMPRSKRRVLRDDKLTDNVAQYLLSSLTTS